MLATNPKSASADSTGAASISYKTPGANVQWQVQQISVEVTPSTNVPDAYVRFNGRVVCATIAGAMDAASGQPYIVIGPQDELIVSWVNALTGSICIATIFYDEQPVGA